MKIILSQDEIYKILADYITNQNLDLTGRHIDIQLTAGRGPKGHYAEIEVTDDEDVDGKPSVSDDSEDDAAINFNFEQAED